MQTSNLTLGVFIALSVLFLVSNSFGLAADVVPLKDSTTRIENKNCGGETAVSFTFTNTGMGGILCWYWTNENPSRIKLTTSCVRPGATTSFNAHLAMPSSGQKKANIQLECYDFWALIGGDKCVDSYSYSEALANKYSGGAEDQFGPRYFDLSCSKMQVTVTPSEGSISLNSGESRDVSISVNNLGDNPIDCTYSGDSIGRISSGGTQSFYVNIKAPSSGSGTTSQSVSILCIDAETRQQAEKDATIRVTYSPNPCFAKIDAATSSYNTASTEIAGANSAIQGSDSRCEGTDKSEPMGYKNQAESVLLDAKGQLEKARSACSNGDSGNAISAAEDAKNKAEQARTYATQTKNAVEKAVADCLSGRKEASDLLKQADSNIRSAESWIERAESVVKNGTDLGMDTHQEKADVETAKSTITNAKTYYQQASSYFDGKDYSMTKKDANEAITKTQDAENSAKKAYNSLFKTVEDANTAKNEMNTAASEIARADQIFSKLAVVVRNMKKNTDMSGTETQIIELRSKIESSRDYSSQAQNKFSAGYFSESVNLATSARDTAASANNRLSRLLEGLTVTVTDSLEKTAIAASAKIAEANSKTNEASATYAASGDEIASARKSIQQANTALQEAKTIISKAKETTDLSEFLALASDAFSKLENVTQMAEKSKTHAQNAINLGYATIGGGAAAVVGTGGVGFLYWKRKNKGKDKDINTPKIKQTTMRFVEKTTPEAAHVDKKNLECPTCGVKTVKHKSKYCNDCGSQLKEISKKKPNDQCEKCDAKIDPQDKFCQSCGNKVAEE
jgi:tetratricopeptide (TPR) repeat protein